jgi:PAS domain S-box-containing protein
MRRPKELLLLCCLTGRGLVRMADEQNSIASRVFRILAGPLLVVLVASAMHLLTTRGILVIGNPGAIFGLTMVIVCLVGDLGPALVGLVLAVAGCAYQYYTADLIDHDKSVITGYVTSTAALTFVTTIMLWYQRRLRRVMELPLKAERELFRAVMASMHDAIVETDWQGIRDVNESFCRMTGFTREALLGARPPFPFWPSDQYASIAAALETSMRGRKLDFELVLTRHDGQRIPVLLSVSRILDDATTSSRILYSFRDITELKHAQDQLRASEQRLSLLVQQTPIAVIVWNLRGQAIEWNPAAERIFGHVAEKAIGQHLSFIMPASSLENVDRTWQSLLSQKGASRHDTENVTADGRIIYCEWYHVPLADAAGAVIGVASLCHDITERRRSQRLLADQGVVLERMALGVPLEGILLALVRMIELHINGALCSILLVNDDGKTLRLAAAPSLPPEFNALVEGFCIGPDMASCGAAAFTGRRVLVADIRTDPRWQRWRDATIPFGLRACHSEPLIARDGKVLGTFAIYFREPRGLPDDDISVLESASRLAAVAIERRREESALRRSELVLRRFVDSNIIGIVICDRTRIFDANDVFLRMVGYSRQDLREGRLRRQALMPPEYIAADDKALREMTTAGACTPFEREYLRKDGSRVPALVGAATIDLDPLKWIGFVVDLTEQRRSARELRDAKEAAEIANRTKDRFLNLLSHELRSPLTPVLTLASVLETDDRLPEAVRADMGVIRRNAELEARLIDDLLELVHMARGPLTPDVDAAVRAIHDATLAETPPPPPGRSESTRALRILLVEDHADTSEVLARMLAGRGHRVTVAGTCRAALDLVLQAEFDLMISDVGLPDGTGHELLQTIQKHRKLPAIALSGFGSEDDVRRSREAGFLEHLTKPINFDVLHNAIAHYAAQSAA